MDGGEHTANLKVYKFEQLDKDIKLEILTVIKENFKREYFKLNQLGNLFARSPTI